MGDEAAGATGADGGQGGGESEGAIRASNQRSQQDSAGAWTKID